MSCGPRLHAVLIGAARSGTTKSLQRWTDEGRDAPTCAAMLRRVAILLGVLLLLSAVLTAVAPRRDRADDNRATTPPRATTARDDVTAAVRATLPRDRIVRARVGDNIELTVNARQLDSATIAGFGLTDAAGPGAPAQFSFRADRAGRFAVRLALSGQRAGRVVVRAARRRSSAGPRGRP